MINNKPCGSCQHYDPIITKQKETTRGWCSKKSVYPTQEGPGQIFPLSVKRVASGELAKPYIVKGKEVEETCELFQEKKRKK